MSWTKLDDLWCEQKDMRVLDYETRWHLLTMAQFCSRSGQYDGYLRRVDALRCSDVPDPDHCLAALLKSPFLELADGGYRLTRSDYFPAEHLRDENAKPRSKASSKSYRDRKAACDGGEHSGRCPRGCPERDRSHDRHDDESETTSHRDGTGLAVTGSTLNTTSENEDEVTREQEWPPTIEPGSAKRCQHCGRVSAFVDGGYCRADACVAARRGKAS